MRKLKNSSKQKKRTDAAFSTGNVFKDIGYSDAESANLLARAELMLKIRDIVQAKGWSQHQAAKVLGVSQPRIAEIFSMDTSYFSVDLLIKYLARLGTNVSFRFSKPKPAPIQDVA